MGLRLRSQALMQIPSKALITLLIVFAYHIIKIKAEYSISDRCSAAQGLL